MRTVVYERIPQALCNRCIGFYYLPSCDSRVWSSTILYVSLFLFLSLVKINVRYNIQVQPMRFQQEYSMLYNWQIPISVLSEAWLRLLLRMWRKLWNHRIVQQSGIIPTRCSQRHFGLRIPKAGLLLNNLLDWLKPLPKEIPCWYLSWQGRQGILLFRRWSYRLRLLLYFLWCLVT